MGDAYTWVIAHCAAQVRIRNVLWRQVAAATVRAERALLAGLYFVYAMPCGGVDAAATMRAGARASCGFVLRIRDVLWRQVAAATERTGAWVSCGFVLRIRNALWRRGRRRYGESGKMLLLDDLSLLCKSPGEVWRGRGPSDLNPQDRLSRFEDDSCGAELALREQKSIPLSFCARKTPQRF